MSAPKLHRRGLAVSIANRKAQRAKRKPGKGAPNADTYDVTASVPPRHLTLWVGKVLLVGKAAHVERMGQRAQKRERWHRDAALAHEQQQERLRRLAERAARRAAR